MVFRRRGEACLAPTMPYQQVTSAILKRLLMSHGIDVPQTRLGRPALGVVQSPHSNPPEIIDVGVNGQLDLHSSVHPVIENQILDGAPRLFSKSEGQSAGHLLPWGRAEFLLRVTI